MHGTLKDCAVGTTRHRPRFGGLGILVLTAALFLARRVAQDAGGRLTLANPPDGGGAEVLFELPAVVGAATSDRAP